MTVPRRELVSVQDTPYYHIVSRCVRRAYLCGEDKFSGRSYEHRRQWVEDRLRILSSLFGIELCAYAVMSNHYHIVVRLRPDWVDTLSDQEVAERWTALYKGPLVLQAWLRDGSVPAAQRATLHDTLKVLRQRLQDLSWFMKCLNEPIARRANQEDDCTGHFWEGRFKSQALRTEAELMACMAYVDLNPVRAAMAATPEESAHTSIKERLQPGFDFHRATQEQTTSEHLQHTVFSCQPLAGFQRAGNTKEQMLTHPTLPFSQSDYLTLVDWTGRIVREDKRGAIAAHAPPILERIKLPPDDWLRQATQFERIRRTKRRSSTKKAA